MCPWEKLPWDRSLEELGRVSLGKVRRLPWDRCLDELVHVSLGKVRRLPWDRSLEELGRVSLGINFPGTYVPRTEPSLAIYI